MQFYKSPVLGLKGGLWLFRKSKKISTASDQNFLSCVKTKYRLPPPPSCRNRVNKRKKPQMKINSLKKQKVGCWSDKAVKVQKILATVPLRLKRRIHRGNTLYQTYFLFKKILTFLQWEPENFRVGRRH